MNRSSLFSAVILAAALPGPAQAADPRFPDWPCVQAKVPEISLVAVWSGPPLDRAMDTWDDDPEIKSLVARLAARRTPLAEAEDAIRTFITGTPEQRQDRATRLFAGLFVTLNRERTEVMNGIERFTRRQRTFAEGIREETQRLRELQDAADADPAKVADLGARLEWDTRMFEERRKTTNYVCEVPVIIDKRLFALGRAIQQALE